MGVPAGEGTRGESPAGSAHGGAASAPSLSALLVAIARAPDLAVERAWRRPLRPGDLVAGRFEILSELGRGGFGVVYEALDRHLGRRVAFKTLRPARTRDELSASWLHREAEAAARLDHPGIVTLFDVGTCDQGPYLVMELLRGETLAERLARGPLPTRQALALAREVAAALAHAHSRGLLHRDLKPANVFLAEDGRVKILDFGLAHLLGSPSPASGGTPAYMAPEQARLEAVDERADVFALGVMLHEMLAGSRPSGPAPRPPRRVPRRLARLVAAATSPDRERRPRDGRALEEALAAARRSLERRTAARTGAAAAAALLAGATLWLARGGPEGERTSVVVADFANETSDPDLDGLSGLLITSLEQSRRLQVMTRSRMFDVLRGLGKEGAARIDEPLARELGRRAGAQALVLASVRKFDDVYAMELRALDPQRDRYLFAVKEQARGKDSVPALIDRLSDRTRLGFQEGERDLRRSRLEVGRAVTANLEAYRHYFRAERLAAQLQHAEAIDEYRRAAALDPGLAPAQLALAYHGFYWLLRDFDRIEDAARDADRLPPKERDLVLAFAAFHGGRLGEARQIARGLAGRFPSEKEIAFMAGELSSLSGDLEGALPHYRRAVELDPRWDWARTQLVYALSLLRRADEALAVAGDGSAPSTPGNLGVVTVARLLNGRTAAGIEAARRALAEAPLDAFTRMNLLAGLAYQGDLAGTRLVVEAARRSPHGGVRASSHGLEATALAYQGRFREGLRVLEKGWSSPRLHPGLLASFRATYLAAAGDLPRARAEASRSAVWTAFDLPLLLRLGDAGAVRRLRAAMPDGSTGAALADALLLRLGGDARGALDALRALDARARGWPSLFHGEVAAELGLDGEAVAALADFEPMILGGKEEIARAGELPRARLLAARALERLGRAGEARLAVERLLAAWKDADPDQPLLAEARALRRRLGGPSR